MITSPRRAACLAALIMTCLWYGSVAGQQPRLEDVLARLEMYLTTYETRLASLVAEEHYEQWTQNGPNEPLIVRRSLTSDFGFLRLPGRPEWLGLRDTFAVDGQLVPDRKERLDRLLADGSRNLADLARRIVGQNARYNLGVVARTINVPMLALDLLGPRHRWRLSFRKEAEDDVGGRAVWVVGFEERERPTVVKTPQGRNHPARGTVWVDPMQGAVLRTVVDFPASDADGTAAATVMVLYRREDTLGLLVPAEMRESYHVKTDRDAATEIHAVARYSKFRQFHSSARVLPVP